MTVTPNFSTEVKRRVRMTMRKRKTKGGTPPDNRQEHSAENPGQKQKYSYYPRRDQNQSLCT